MSNDKAVGGVQAAAVELPHSQLALCNEKHQVHFFCQQCDRLYCGDCYILAHRRENRDHDVEEINELLKREDKQICERMDEFKKIAEAAEVTANARHQKMDEASEVLTRLVSEATRLLMTSECTREEQQQWSIYHESLAVLQRVGRSLQDVDPEKHPIAALMTRRSINALLTEQLEKANQKMNLIPEKGAPDLVTAILKSLVKLAGKETVEGSTYD